MISYDGGENKNFEYFPELDAFQGHDINYVKNLLNAKKNSANQFFMHLMKNALRRLDKNQFDTVIFMTQAGARPRTVLSSLLNQDPNTATSSKNISNAKMKRRTEYLAGRSPIQAVLLQSLEESEWESRYETDAENQIQALFFGHPKSVELARTYNAS
jgi:hypothetical protein